MLSVLELTRRAFLQACLAGGGLPLRGAAGAPVDPIAFWRGELAARAARRKLKGRLVAAGSDAAPWDELGRLLRGRHRDLRRHFVFEYYPWYAAHPVRHWQQWGRVPPVDVAASTMPLLGAYDSRATAVIEQHARWMAEAGVGVINLSWWGVDSFEDRVTPMVMDVMHAHDIHVAFHIEPYGPPRIDRLADDLLYLIRTYGEQRRWDAFFLHERADGTAGPVFKLFETTLPQQTVDCHGVVRAVSDYVQDDVWRRAIERAQRAVDGMFDRVTLLSDTWNVVRARDSGLDGIAVYDSSVEREAWLGFALAATRLGMPFSMNTNAGLDEIARRGLPADSCLVPRPFVPRIGAIDWSRDDHRERAHARAVARIDETLEWTLLLQTHPWLGNVDLGFFLVYITSFNEWHEGSQFEPMRPRGGLTADERSVGYHNPWDGSARLDRLTELLRRLGV